MAKLTHLSKTFFVSISQILDKHAPLKKLSKYKFKFKTKPQIITALQKSISLKVIPIHKKDSTLDFTNYHLISLLSNLEKILEKFIHNRLTTFLNIKDIIYHLQFGFCQNYSTSYALIHLTETIKEALDQGKYGCRIFAHLQKALTQLTITFYWVS